MCRSLCVKGGGREQRLCWLVMYIRMEKCPEQSWHAWKRAAINGVGAKD